MWFYGPTIIAKLNQLLKQEAQLAVDLSKLQAEIAHNTDVAASVVKTLNDLAAIIRNFPPSTDPQVQAAVDAMNATLEANDAAMAGAVTADAPVQTP